MKVTHSATSKFYVYIYIILFMKNWTEFCKCFYNNKKKRPTNSLWRKKKTFLRVKPKKKNNRRDNEKRQHQKRADSCFLCMRFYDRGREGSLTITTFREPKTLEPKDSRLKNGVYTESLWILITSVTIKHKKNYLWFIGYNRAR